MRGLSSSFRLEHGRAPGARRAAVGFAAEALLGLLLGLALGFLVVAAALVFLALARSRRLRARRARRHSRSARRRASSSAILRSSASRSAGIGERVGAARCVPPRSACAAPRRTAWAAARPERRARGRCGLAGAACRRGRLRRGGGAAAARRALRRPCSRRRGRGASTFSTTTGLVRPWLKLWRTTPVSVRGLSVSVLVDAQLLSSGFFVSVIPFQFVQSRFARLGRLSSASPCRSESVRGDRKRARNVSLAGPASRAACTTFDRPNAKSNSAEENAVDR